MRTLYKHCVYTVSFTSRTATTCLILSAPMKIPTSEGMKIKGWKPSTIIPFIEKIKVTEHITTKVTEAKSHLTS